ncbi:MotA/TolQ/ExbB proton channel family protein [Marinimicrobium agarilyticum]|uniref:MotA/TolQ/ExbB proton channel family protein n=1 Tax=Marinimicrobium agarilyticum TaxID=306546 RepID=UPI000683E9A3|nr:MotA/TolQ/ExbB proton channel family protein [Marinimicrobium agarilyticum]
MNWGDLIVFRSPIAIAIVILAVAIYSQLIKLCFLMPTSREWAARVRTSSRSFKVVSSALPLLGLLGTINGLMSTFGALSYNMALDLNTLLASGISEAMFTTQLGLALVVPAIILQTTLNSRFQRYLLEFQKHHASGFTPKA